MAIINKGKSFTNGEQLTASKLNQVIDNATFTTSAVDNVSTQLAGEAIIVKDGGVTTAKIADSAVTTAKIADANVTFAKLTDVIDDDTMATATDTTLATSESIKAYVDSNGITQSTGPAPYYGVRAWCHYNGFSQLIEAQGNIASVTRHNTGDYEFFFTEEMPSSDYAISLSYSNEISGVINPTLGTQHTVGFIGSRSTTSFRVQHYAVSSSGHPTDKAYVGVSVIC